MTSCARSRHWARSGELVGVRAAQVVPAVCVPPAARWTGASAAPAASVTLRSAGRDAWAAAVSHPMVRAIAAGTLPHETFRGYFEQNVRYLEDYARAIALAAAKAPDREGLDVLSRFLGQIIATEIPPSRCRNARFAGKIGRAHV